MKTTFKTVDELLVGNNCPLPLQTIPNFMGINLCSVEGISWTRQKDNQLVSLTVHFIPENDLQRSGEGYENDTGV